jgi:hypothetical protein
VAAFVRDEASAPGVHYVYEPTLTPQQLVEWTSSGLFAGVRVRPKTVLPEVVSSIDMRIGTGTDNFNARVAAKKSAHATKQQPYLLMNTPAQNAVATAEWAQSALWDGMAPCRLRAATADVMSSKWLSSDLSNAANPYKAEAAEMAEKTVAVLGMGNIGQVGINYAVVAPVNHYLPLLPKTHQNLISSFFFLSHLLPQETARRLKQQRVNVVAWGYVRADGTHSFTRDDAVQMGVRWAPSVAEAVADADGVVIHTPGWFNHARFCQSLLTFAFAIKLSISYPFFSYLNSALASVNHYLPLPLLANTHSSIDTFLTLQARPPPSSTPLSLPRCVVRASSSSTRRVRTASTTLRYRAPSATVHRAATARR